MPTRSAWPGNMPRGDAICREKAQPREIALDIQAEAETLNFRGELDQVGVQRSRAIAFEVEGDKREAEFLEDLDELAGHFGRERARQLVGSDLNPNQFVVMADAELAETELPQCLFPFLDDGQPVRRNLDAVGNS